MFSQDFILRQVQQLTQALAVVLFHKQAGQDDEAQAALDESIEEALGIEPEALRRIDLPALLALCSASGSLLPDHALAVADLLQEDETASGRERALWLYEAVLEAGGAVPLDIYERLASLRASLLG